MATYPIKMLKDEQNIPFVPLTSTECIKDPNGYTLEQRLATKLGPANLHGGTNISVRTVGDECYIDLDLPASLNIIDNLTTSTSGQGALDAHQGYVLKELIDNLPTVVDDVTSTSSTNALSANQGYILNNKFNNYTPTSLLPSVINNLTSTSTSDSLSAYQGKILNDKFANYLPLTGTAVSANYPTGFYINTSSQTWGNQDGTFLTGWRTNSTAYAEIAFRDNGGKLNTIIDGYYYQKEGVYRVLDTSDLGSYGFYKWPTGALTLSSSTSPISREITITTKGRPVFVMVSGDNNPVGDTCWFNIYIYRDGTLLCHQIDESHGDSWNIPFALSYLDAVSAGSHTYKVEFAIGSGTTNLNESGTYQSPNFVVYEI